MNNPFISGFYNGKPVEAIDVESRLHRVKKFSRRELLAALEVPDLQKTVRRAIERRLIKLQARGR